MYIIKAHYTFSKQYLYKLKLYIVYIINCVPKEYMAKITLLWFSIFFNSIN